MMTLLSVSLKSPRRNIDNIGSSRQINFTVNCSEVWVSSENVAMFPFFSRPMKEPKIIAK